MRCDPTLLRSLRLCHQIDRPRRWECGARIVLGLSAHLQAGNRPSAKAARTHPLPTQRPLALRFLLWTRAQSTRTAAELTLSVDLVADDPYKKYIALAPRVLQLMELGMSQGDIAKELNTTPRTVRRAQRWAVNWIQQWTRPPSRVIISGMASAETAPAPPKTKPDPIVPVGDTAERRARRIPLACLVAVLFAFLPEVQVLTGGATGPRVVVLIVAWFAGPLVGGLVLRIGRHPAAFLVGAFWCAPIFFTTLYSQAFACTPLPCAYAVESLFMLILLVPAWGLAVLGSTIGIRVANRRSRLEETERESDDVASTAEPSSNARILWALPIGTLILGTALWISTIPEHARFPRDINGGTILNTRYSGFDAADECVPRSELPDTGATLVRIGTLGEWRAFDNFSGRNMATLVEGEEPPNVYRLDVPSSDPSHPTIAIESNGCFRLYY